MKAPHEKWRCPGELRAANDDGKLGIGRLPNQGLGGGPSISLQEPDEIRSGRKQNQNATDDITPQATHMPPVWGRHSLPAADATAAGPARPGLDAAVHRLGIHWIAMPVSERRPRRNMRPVERSGDTDPRGRNVAWHMGPRLGLRCRDRLIGLL